MSENQKQITTNLKKYLKDGGVNARIQDLLKNRKDQFIVTLSTIAANNKALSSCEPKSVVQGALTATAMNLPLNPNLGYVYLIPYNDRNTGMKYAQLQFGYKAYIQLAMRSGQFKSLGVTPVHEGQILTADPLSGYEFDFSKQDSNQIIGYAARFDLLNGFSKTLYMSVEEMNKHANRYSNSFRENKGVWIEDYDVMAQKTVLKMLLSKYAPLSVDMERAVMTDQSIVKDYDTGEVDYIDNNALVETAAEASERKAKERLEKHITNAKTLKKLIEAEDQVDALPDEDKLKELYSEKEKTLQE